MKTQKHLTIFMYLLYLAILTEIKEKYIQISTSLNISYILPL